ncbi:FAD-dependent oxidoreductase [Mesorhizobium sp.]|uniref:FAD-dependent oxidoreductase n=1 Tax=Mesorhizobium sp. TaxID=1871066 RepID=UPI000FE3CBD4|nr:FAD-dependent oxidoreductase [Mesorhizobium sp.]RWA61148.1 MAG: FAD-dependent oxidoreductase [Mesorhizobium sp.]RWB94028.1 MAG: FAD-dependent oxidoreductase [Mesorhizobium sp.]RWG81108.1 MAG: FAD-dependent oxidoreductase [Mesorhizobium sp.]RWK15195.1 MAG: FAD-dependent oxidoreductase [Mesorhizobium sp.]
MTGRPLPDRAPVVIIGGGVIGTSTLYHLAKRGVEGAVLLERKQLASGTTWHAAGIVGQLRDSGAQTELSKYTARLFTELEAETGQATGYKQNGTIHLALSEIRLEQLRRNHDHAARVGIESHLLGLGDLKEKWPWVNYDGVLGGFFIPSNGQVNPLDVTQAFARGARSNGCLIFENTAAKRIVTRNGRVVAVETERGTIATEKVLLAGGMWTARFAKAHGITVPLHAAEHFYIVTEAIPNLPKTLPGLVVLEERLYAKEDAGKLLIGGFEARGKAWARNGIPESFEFDELPFDIEHLEPVLESIFARLPGLAEFGVQTFFNGPESFTPDGRPYLGPAPEMPGLFVAAGMNSNGILNSGGVGLTMAEWLIDGMPSRGMGSMLAARAHPFQVNAAYNAERVTEAVGLHWGLHWPGRQIDTARGVRRVPLHDRLNAKGAVFAERIGWEVPMYFDQPGKGWPTAPSIGRQEWFPLVEMECLAARDAAALLDQSMYGKILVQGPDAARALNRVCGAEMNVPVGTSVYAQFLNQRGGIEADITATRVGFEKFVIVTGHPSQIRDQAWIREHADPDWRFEVFDATSSFSLLSVHGPRSREILSSISTDDLSEEAFPFGAAREIDLAYARVWAIRRSFLGELGYELLISTEFTAGVYEALLAAGEPRGLRHIGMFAMNHCRMEKAFRHFGHDIGEDDTPYEAGLGFAVKLEKAEPFVGSQALAKQKTKGAATPHRTVAIAVEGATPENGPFLIHNEPIWNDGRLVGHVTSGAWGFRLRKSLGMATLHNPEGVSKQWIENGRFTVRVAGQDFPLTVQLAPFYDPAGERMRGGPIQAITTNKGNQAHDRKEDDPDHRNLRYQVG